ncbi:MAG: NRDE family protein [Pyrinomonadaceae bacterium]|nr:NRDE family protein [Pyrinomonadaceae bacterium]
MCVIFISIGQIPEYPLLLLANRDEYYERPTEKAEFWEDFPSIFAGRDLVSKGTWLGVSKTGRIAAVTNYRDPNQKKGTRSRGDLVADFLKAEIPAEEYLKSVQADSGDYTGFNLIVGEINPERQELFYYSNIEEKIRSLAEGLYGLSNNLLDVPWPKVKKGKKRLTHLITNAEIEKEKFFEILSDTELADDNDLPDTGIGFDREKLLSAIFIETPIYGSRCSTVLMVDESFEFDFEERVFV